MKNHSVDIELLDQPLSKRKASQFEDSLQRLSIASNKRVSFGKTSVLYSNQKCPDDIDAVLASTLTEISGFTANVDETKLKIEKSNHEITGLLKNISDLLGITREITDEEMELLNNTLENEKLQLISIEKQKEKLCESLVEKENELLKELGLLQQQEKTMEKAYKQVTNEDKFSYKQYEVYKKLLKSLGITVKTTMDDYIILCKGSEFTVTPTGPTYLLTPNHDKMSLFAKGSHKICKSQLKFLAFRLIDN